MGVSAYLEKYHLFGTFSNRIKWQVHLITNYYNEKVHFWGGLGCGAQDHKEVDISCSSGQML